jgi:hypothetical protein
MRDQHVVNLADPGLFCRGNDAICVATVIVRPTSVNEQRLVCGRDKQRCLSAFDIDEVDL